MSINNDLLDDDTIVAPSDFTPNQIPVTITVANDRHYETELSTLVNADVEFKLVNENVERVVDLETIEGELLATESISRNTARYLDCHFMGLTDKVAIEEFTIQPSKTNYQLAARHVRYKLSLEQAAVLELHNNFMTKSIRDTKTVLDVITKDYLDDYYLCMSAAAKEALIVITESSSNRNTIVPYLSGNSTEFIDLATIDITVLDIQQLQLSASVASTTVNDLTNIQKSLESIVLKAFILSAVNEPSVSQPTSSEILLKYAHDPISILTVAKFFNSQVFKTYIESLPSSINDMIVYFDRLAELTVANSMSDVKTLLATEGEYISKAVTASLNIAIMMSTTVKLAANVNSLFKLLTTLTK